MHLFVNVEHVSNNSQQANPKNRENEGKRISTHLQVKSPKPESAEWTEEKQGYHNLNDKGSHDTQLLPPNWQLVGKPGQRGGNTLSLIVVCQCCPTHGEKYQQNEKRNYRQVPDSLTYKKEHQTGNIERYDYSGWLRCHRSQTAVFKQ